MQAENSSPVSNWDIWYYNLVSFGTAAAVLFAVFVVPVVLISFLFPGFARKCREVLSVSVGSNLKEMATIISKSRQGLNRIFRWYCRHLQSKRRSTTIITLLAAVAVLLTIPGGSDETLLYLFALALVACCVGVVLHLRKKGRSWRDIRKLGLKIAFWLTASILAIAVISTLLLWLDIPMSDRLWVRIPVGR